MARKKPQSAKEHKAQIQLKRAIKRGDVDKSELSELGKPSSGRGRGRGRSSIAGPSSKVESVRRLMSSFSAISANLLEQSKVAAANEVLPRPIPPEATIWPMSSRRIAPEREAELSGKMTCLKRPKWRFDMSKKEVEHNEEGIFKKWLAQTDAIVDEWVQLSEEARAQAESQVSNKIQGHEPTISGDAKIMPLSPSAYERNLEVWRQLWRVSELSQIILVLLDARCPLLHFPPSFQNYLSASQCKIILVLTKVDSVGPERAQAWDEYLRLRFPTAQVVMVEAYADRADQPGENSTPSRGKRGPYIPQTFKERLILALKEAYQDFLQPPERIREDPEKLKSWSPRVKRDINWDGLLSSSPQPYVPQNTRTTNNSEIGSEAGEAVEPVFITVGLVGQPNVGKSSLLNALMGKTRVRASKTPGKTKHFQTLFWTPEIRLVDCPGLVLPALVPLELQVLSGVLAIARMPAIPLCLGFAGRLLPLEKILSLDHPSSKDATVEDKRTWRGGMQKKNAPKDPEWTAMDIMTAYAEKKRWVTAKAGRPDVNRAGNAILRALADGRIRWGFLPPNTDAAQLLTSSSHGILIDDGSSEEPVHFDSDDEDDASDAAGLDSSAEDEVEEEKDEAGEDEAERPVRNVGGRFALLGVESDSEGSSGE